MSTTRELLCQLAEVVDDEGEVAMTGNTRALLEEAEARGLVRAVSGKFRCVEPGHLNSVYTVRKWGGY